MGISRIASKGEKLPCPSAAWKHHRGYFQFFSPKRIQATASMCMLLSAKPVPPFFLFCSSHCCSSRQTKLWTQPQKAPFPCPTHQSHAEGRAGMSSRVLMMYTKWVVNNRAVTALSQQLVPVLHTNSTGISAGLSLETCLIPRKCGEISVLHVLKALHSFSEHADHS